MIGRGGGVQKSYNGIGPRGIYPSSKILKGKKSLYISTFWTIFVVFLWSKKGYFNCMKRRESL